MASEETTKDWIDRLRSRIDPAVAPEDRLAHAVLREIQDRTGAAAPGGVPEPEGDEHGYLTDAWLEAFRSSSLRADEAARFLLETFPAAVDLMHGYPSLAIKDAEDAWAPPAKRIEFHTGGWSGAEDLIAAMLGHFWIDQCLVEWKRGGHYVFEVPLSMLQYTIPPPACAA